jgi:hypothetical protein
MKKVIVRYGIDTTEVTVGATATVGSIINNPSTKIILGYGDNVKALVGGVEQDSSAQVADGMEIVLETRANSKATEVLA